MTNLKFFLVCVKKINAKEKTYYKAVLVDNYNDTTETFIDLDTYNLLLDKQFKDISPICQFTHDSKTGYYRLAINK